MAHNPNGRIVNTGMGGFLNPPTHPEHYFSVTIRDGDRVDMSLSAAVRYEWVPESIKNRALDILDNWQKPDNIQVWIRHVLGYFKNCYSKDGVDRNVSNCLIWIPKGKKPYGDNFQHFKRSINKHLGVMFIREFYPNFIPTHKHFKEAFWGKA